MSHKIITIARQFGSGGHEVAQRLSDQLGIPLYDRNLVEMAAERMGHSPVSIEKADESALSSFLAGYQIPKEPNSVTGYGLSLNDSTYVTQTIIIEALAQKGPCVIVGRCGDYVLRSHPDLIDVFICADMEFIILSDSTETRQYAAAFFRCVSIGTTGSILLIFGILSNLLHPIYHSFRLRSQGYA